MPNNADSQKDLHDILKAFIRAPFSTEIQATPYAWLWQSVDPPRANCYTAMSPDKLAIYAFLKEIFGLFPANPSKLHRRNAFNALYQKQAFGEGEYDRLDDKLKQDIREKKRAIAIVGQRGAGKTSFLNMWLHENTHEFLEIENKILWFRVDASKLYNWQPTDIVTYFKVHAAYVIFVYALQIDPDVSRNSTFYALIHRLPLSKQDKQLVKFIKNRLATDTDGVEDRSVLIVREILSNKSILNQFIAFYDRFLSVAVDRRYRIMAIVDGVDNLSASRDDDRYVEMCRAVRGFFHYLRDCPEYICLLLARPGTVPELEIAVIGHNHHAAKDAVSFAFSSIAIPRARIESILEKKISGMQSEALESHRERLFEKARRDGGNEQAVRDAIVGSGLSRSIKDYMQELTGSLKKVFHTIGRDNSFFVTTIDQSLLELLFAGDIRAFFRALRQGIMLREYYATVNVPHANSPHLMLEIFMLCGSFYKVTRHQMGADNARRNAMDVAYDRRVEESEPEWAPNIFWYDLSAASVDGVHQWHGLSGLRLLQLLHARKLTRTQILATLKSLFGYSESVLDEQIDAFHAFGLIHAQATTGKVSLEGINVNYDLVYETTLKGRTIATLSMYYLKWQYFLALDTPLYAAFHPSAASETFLKLYRMPENPSESRWHFFDASVSTCATFLRHVCLVDQAEMKLVTEDVRLMSVKGVLGDQNIVQKVFSLPPTYWASVDKLTEALMAARRRSGKTRLSSMEEFEGHIRGFFALK